MTEGATGRGWGTQPCSFCKNPFLVKVVYMFSRVSGSVVGGDKDKEKSGAHHFGPVNVIVIIARETRK